MTDSTQVIAGGTIASEYGTFRADIVVRGGRIVALMDDARDIDGERFDASGLVIFPGGIDMHVHMREPSRLVREGFYHGTSSAVAGGITTVIEMPQADPLVADPETFRLKRELAAAGSLCDFGLYAAVIGQEKGELEALQAEGAMGFKAFLCKSSPGYPRLDDAMLLACLQQLHDLDALLVVHAENDDLLQAGLARMAAEGRDGPAGPRRIAPADRGDRGHQPGRSPRDVHEHPPARGARQHGGRRCRGHAERAAKAPASPARPARSIC